MIKKNSDLEIYDCGVLDIVHCKDCVHSHPSRAKPLSLVDCLCSKSEMVVRSDFFCKRGVRKEEPAPEITRKEKIRKVIDLLEELT